LYKKDFKSRNVEKKIVRLVKTKNWGKPGNCINFDSLKKKKRPQSELCAWAPIQAGRKVQLQIFPEKRIFLLN